MGIFDRRSDSTPTPAKNDDSALGQAATQLVQRLLSVGIDGKAFFDSAETVARRAQAKGGADQAIDAIVAEHLKLAAAQGFVTGLGGFVTLPVALPTNVAGFYLLATRMVAAVADVRGYDVDDPSTRSAILLALVGADADDVLRKAGQGATGRITAMATERLPAPVLMAVNKGVAFRILTQTGRKVFSRFGKAIPFLGGALGAGLDTWTMRGIAQHARDEFPARGAGAA